jgi:hypothetical protein
MRSSEFFDFDEFRFKIVVQVNEASDKLVGIKLDEFSKIAMAGYGMFQVLTIFWPFDKTFWTRFAKFFIGSIFLSHLKILTSLSSEMQKENAFLAWSIFLHLMIQILESGLQFPGALALCRQVLTL